MIYRNYAYYCTMKETIETIMKVQGVSKDKLATLTGIPYLTLYRRLKEPESFTICELRKISIALNVELYKLLK